MRGEEARGAGHGARNSVGTDTHTRDRVTAQLLHCKGQHACKQCVQANAHPPVRAPQALSSHLAPSPKHTDQEGQLRSKQTQPTARQGTLPVCRGSPAPHHPRAPGSCFLPPPRSPQQQPLQKPKVPSRRAYLARKPL